MAWSEEPGVGESDAAALIRRGTREQADGNLEEAESLFRDAERLLLSALERSEGDIGAHDDELPILLRELSRLYILTEANDRAEAPLVRLLTITRAQGENRPEVATVLSSLAAVRHSLGDYASAEQLYRQALTIREKTLTPNHVSTAATMESLAEACAARGRFSEAVALCNRALAIRELTLGVNDASVRVARKRIADLQLEGHEENRISTPTRAIAAQQASSGEPNAEEGRPTPTASRSPAVVGAWHDELAAVRDELEATAPVFVDRRAPRTSRATATSTVSSTTIVVGAAVAVLLVALGIWQFGKKPERNTFAEAEPYNPASRQAMQPAARAVIPPLAPSASADSSAVAGPSSPPLDSKATTPNVLAREEPRAQLVPPKAPLAQSPQRPSATTSPRNDANAATRSATVATPPVVDSTPARATAPAVEKAPVNAPTSPTLIGAAPQPQYPDALRDQQVEGEVVVQFVVDETGRADVASMTVVRSPHVLLTNAVRAVLPQFRFEPARTAPPQSIPRPETVRYSFTFHAPRK